MNLDDARLTPLFCRLATAYWRIVQTRADEVAFPILRARISVDVDMEGVTWFPFSVHSDQRMTKRFQRRAPMAALDRPAEPGERKARELVSLLIVGLRDRRGAATLDPAGDGCVETRLPKRTGWTPQLRLSVAVRRTGGAVRVLSPKPQEVGDALRHLGGCARQLDSFESS